ncbi:hypothetical protein RIF29_08421 [Crotalaria pallida]|uniref:MYND-type domain-containing protein n=1 Tax=Crotalaria pallida TaxID=3830 RepID=A0AAN9FX35_CROPI
MRNKREVLCYPSPLSPLPPLSPTRSSDKALIDTTKSSSFDTVLPITNMTTTQSSSSSMHTHKRQKKSPQQHNNIDFFEYLHDDLVLAILSKLSSTATTPSDFISVLITCKKLHNLGLNSQVLRKACNKTFAVKAKNWCDSSHRFLKQCSDAGNVDACYTLGMIRFYCLQNRPSGACLMAKAAMNSHAPALFSLGVIQFNGSGGTKKDKDLRAGVALCARAAFLGHVDALREVGHCLHDGYGVKQNVTEGRKYLLQANARELAAVLSSVNKNQKLTWGPSPVQTMNQNPVQKFHLTKESGCALMSDYGCNLPVQESHPANRFMREWFAARIGSGVRLCSYLGCGRPETRKNEFRRCSLCGLVIYCSRACQAIDWRLRHKVGCLPIERWFNEDEVDGESDADNNDIDDEDNDDIEEMDNNDTVPAI